MNYQVENNHYDWPSFLTTSSMNQLSCSKLWRGGRVTIHILVFKKKNAEDLSLCRGAGEERENLSVARLPDLFFVFVFVFFSTAGKTQTLGAFGL